MIDVVVPKPVQDYPHGLTVKEYLLDPSRSWQVVGIHDGWVPLAIRGLEHTIYLAVQVDTSRPEEPEHLFILHPGEDIYAISRSEARELLFLGDAGGRYVFLGVTLEAPVIPERRIGRSDLEDLSTKT